MPEFKTNTAVGASSEGSGSSSSHANTPTSCNDSVSLTFSSRSVVTSTQSRETTDYLPVFSSNYRESTTLTDELSSSSSVQSDVSSKTSSSATASSTESSDQIDTQDEAIYPCLSSTDLSLPTSCSQSGVFFATSSHSSVPPTQPCELTNIPSASDHSVTTVDVPTSIYTVQSPVFSTISPFVFTSSAISTVASTQSRDLSNTPSASDHSVTTVGVSSTFAVQSTISPFVFTPSAISTVASTQSRDFSTIPSASDHSVTTVDVSSSSAVQSPVFSTISPFVFTPLAISTVASTRSRDLTDPLPGPSSGPPPVTPNILRRDVIYSGFTPITVEGGLWSVPANEASPSYELESESSESSSESISDNDKYSTSDESTNSDTETDTSSEVSDQSSVTDNGRSPTESDSDGGSDYNNKHSDVSSSDSNTSSGESDGHTSDDKGDSEDETREYTDGYSIDIQDDSKATDNDKYDSDEENDDDKTYTFYTDRNSNDIQDGSKAIDKDRFNTYGVMDGEKPSTSGLGTYFQPGSDLSISSSCHSSSSVPETSSSSCYERDRGHKRKRRDHAPVSDVKRRRTDDTLPGTSTDVPNRRKRRRSPSLSDNERLERLAKRQRQTGGQQLYPCPSSCKCKTRGRLVDIPQIDRCMRVVQPLYVNLLKSRTLARSNVSGFPCCENLCSFRWFETRIPNYALLDDY